MRIINASYETLTPIEQIQAIPKQIELAARTCYKSSHLITDNSANRMCQTLIKNGHEAMLEHGLITIKFIVDRAIANEIVRHRIASYAQESTRYVNYQKSELTFIKPCFFNDEYDYGYTDNNYFNWHELCKWSEYYYLKMIENGAKPEEARTVLPLSTATEIIVSMNIRALRHFLNLRALGTTGKPHPQIKEVALPLLCDLINIVPCLFEDLKEVKCCLF